MGLASERPLASPDLAFRDGRLPSGNGPYGARGSGEVVVCATAAAIAYIKADEKRRGERLRWVPVGSDGVTVRDDVPAPVVEAATAMALSEPDG